MTVRSTRLRWFPGLATVLVVSSSLLLSPHSAQAGDPLPGESTCPPLTASGRPNVLTVTSLTGPSRLAPGSTAEISLTVMNPASPNQADCDSGLQLEIVTLGTLRPAGAMSGGEGVECAEESAGGISTIAGHAGLSDTGGYRCVAARFQGGAQTQLTVSVQATAAGKARVDAFAWRLDEPRTSSALATWKVLEVDVSGAAAPPPASQFQAIRQGATGPRVEAIQHLLNQHGASLDVDGDFGPITAGAVRDFQRGKVQPVDGNVTEATWSRLRVTVKRGDKGDAVSALQTLLNAHGQDVAIDGDFGPQTDAAVRALQSEKNIPVDGLVGPVTWAVLISE